MSLKDMFESEEFFGALLVGLALSIILIAVLVIVIKRKQQAGYKDKPVNTAYAKVLAKRNVVPNNHMGGFFVLFEFDDGVRREFSIDYNRASVIAENDEGNLTYQGTKFINFERNRPNND